MTYRPEETYAVVRIGFDLSLVVPKYKLSDTIDLLTEADVVDNRLVMKELDGEQIGFNIRFVKGFVLNEANGFEAPEKPSLFGSKESPDQ